MLIRSLKPANFCLTLLHRKGQISSKYLPKSQCQSHKLISFMPKRPEDKAGWQTVQDPPPPTNKNGKTGARNRTIYGLKYAIAFLKKSQNPSNTSNPSQNGHTYARSRNRLEHWGRQGHGTGWYSPLIILGGDGCVWLWWEERGALKSQS